MKVIVGCLVNETDLRSSIVDLTDRQLLVNGKVEIVECGVILDFDHETGLCPSDPEAHA